jgi:carboxyl-terminal processing protease
MSLLSTKNLRCALAPLALGLLISPLSGCGGGANNPLSGIGNALGFGPTEAQEVKEYVDSWYWWLGLGPSADVSNLDTAEEALEVLRYKEKDRYSFVEKYAAYDSFFRAGTTVAFGITYRQDTDRVTIRLVQPGSPAEVAGLKRGDAITAIGGVTVTALIASNKLIDAFGPSEVGVQKTFTLERGAIGAGGATEVAVTKGQFNINHVIASGQQSMPSGEQAGYVYLGAFTDQTRAQWRAALQPLAASGITKYVVDLRYNGGGTLISSQQVASSLASPTADNQRYAKVTHNRLHTRSDTEYRFQSSERLVSALKIAFIVDKSTCSAAEALIQGLKPFAQIALIGATTCGKPVGFNPQLIADGDKVLNLVDFELSNSTNETDYFDGLAPTCTVADDLSKAIGSAQEGMNSAALYWLDTTTCPVATKSVPTSASATLPFKAPRNLADYFSLR